MNEPIVTKHGFKFRGRYYSIQLDVDDSGLKAMRIVNKDTGEDYTFTNPVDTDRTDSVYVLTDGVFQGLLDVLVSVGAVTRTMKNLLVGRNAYPEVIAIWGLPEELQDEELPPKASYYMEPGEDAAKVDLPDVTLGSDTATFAEGEDSSTDFGGMASDEPGVDEPGEDDVALF